MESETPGASDEEMIETYRSAPESAGGRAAISEIFRRYESRIAVWCLRVLGRREDAADCTQEILLKLYERVDGFRGDSKFSTWVYTVTRNLCLNWIRDHRRGGVETSLEGGDEPIEIPDERVEDASARLERDEDRAALRRLLAETLTPEEARIMYLHYGHGLTLDAISDRMELTNRSGAKAFIVSAKRKLKSALPLFLASQERGQSVRSAGPGAPAKGARPAPQRHRQGPREP